MKMKTYCKYYVSLHGGKFNFRLHSYHIFLRHYCVQTFLLSSSMSYSLSGRQTDIVCTRWILKFILPWFSVIPMQISAHIWNFFLGSTASFSVFRTAQVHLCILCLSLSDSTEAELVLKHSSSMKLWAFTCHWTVLWNCCCSQQGNR